MTLGFQKNRICIQCTYSYLDMDQGLFRTRQSQRWISIRRRALYYFAFLSSWLFVVEYSVFLSKTRPISISSYSKWIALQLSSSSTYPSTYRGSLTNQELVIFSDFSYLFQMPICFNKFRSSRWFTATISVSWICPKSPKVCSLTMTNLLITCLYMCRSTIILQKRRKMTRRR